MKLVWKILLAGMALLVVFLVLEKVFSGEPLTWKDWLLLLLCPLMFYMFVLVAPTIKVTFTEEGYRVYWRAALGPLTMKEVKRPRVAWQDVHTTYSYFPPWLPLHMVGVVGGRRGRRVQFVVGSLMTQKRRAIVYLLDHAPEGAVDQEVRELGERYRKKLA